MKSLDWLFYIFALCGILAGLTIIIGGVVLLVTILAYILPVILIICLIMILFYRY